MIPNLGSMRVTEFLMTNPQICFSHPSFLPYVFNIDIPKNRFLRAKDLYFFSELTRLQGAGVHPDAALLRPHPARRRPVLHLQAADEADG